MKKLYISLLVVFFIWGCKENPNQPQSEQEISDTEALLSIISDDALFESDKLLLDDGDVTSSAKLSKLSAPISPKKWGRKIKSLSRTIDSISTTDTTAVVLITNVLEGYIWILQTDTTLPIIKKNFTEKTKRIVKFKRIDRLPNKRKNWAITEVSALKGGTEISNIQIQKVTFFIGNDTLEVTDPLNYFLKVGKTGKDALRNISKNFNENLKLRVEVISADPDSDIVTAHRPFYLNLWRQFRAPMALVSSTSISGGKFLRVYEHSWRGVWSGRHHAIVSAITRESIYDDAKPFSSQIWGIPFIVTD